MKPESIRELRDAQPFVPFRICLSDGKYYDVPHRDFLLMQKTSIDVGVASDALSGIYDKIPHFASPHCSH